LKTVHRVVVGEFVIVEEKPAHSLETLIAGRRELASGFGEPQQYRAGLGHAFAVHLKHRDFAHRIGLCPPLRVPRLTASKIDTDRLPIETGAIEIERNLVGVSGSTDAMELVMSHFRSPTGGLAVCAASSPIRRSASAAMLSGAWITSRSSAQRYDEIRRSRHCCTHCTISVFSSMRAIASALFARRQFRHQFRLALRLRSSSMTRTAEGKERLEPGDVVAHVLDQLLIARGVRAVRLVDQLAAIGGAVEHHLPAATARAAAGNRRTRSSRRAANAAARSGDRRDREAGVRCR
jgi:hypothetical protein